MTRKLLLVKSVSDTASFYDQNYWSGKNLFDRGQGVGGVGGGRGGLGNN